MNKKKNQNVQSENDNDTNVNYETFTIHKNSSNRQYIIHNFRIDCWQIPIHSNFLCPYEFSSKIDKINNICFRRFNSEHFQYNTHSLYKFKIPKIPILQNYIIPSQKNDPENYTQAICILFTSWHTFFDIKSNITISWEMTLKNVYPTLTDLHKTIIKNLASYMNVKNQEMQIDYWK